MKKKIFYVCGLLLMSITIYAQPFGYAIENYRIIRQEYENSSGEKGSTIFSYGNDNDSEMFKGFWSLKDGSRYSENYYQYDCNNNLISAFRDFSDSLTSFEFFQYDTLGHKIFECFQRSDGRKGTASYKYNMDLLVEANLDNFKGWLSCDIFYEYDEEKNRERGIIKTDGRKIGEIQYQYDSVGNLIQEFWDFNGKWSQTFHFIYENTALDRNFYSSPYLICPSNYRISSEDYSFNGETGGPSEYIYNSDGLMTQKIFTRSDGLSTSTFYTYDKNAKLISSERSYSDGEKARFTYSYDDASRLVMRNFFRSDTLYGYEYYLYDCGGRLKKAYLKNFDTWLSGTIDFETDYSGSMKTGHFTGEDGFNADIDFIYNEENLLSEIIWLFSFGKYQKYNFFYEPSIIK